MRPSTSAPRRCASRPTATRCGAAWPPATSTRSAAITPRGPWTPSSTPRQGVADLEPLMPMLFSEGVVTGRITLDQFVALTSARAARLFGLYPRKGTIAVGSDADLTLWDPGEQRVINGAAMASRAGYSVYDGWAVSGWPRFVLRPGQPA